MTNTIEKLIQDLNSKDGIIRKKARLELVKIGEETILPVSQLLSSKEHKTRWEAIKTLSEISSSQAIPIFIEHLKDDDFDIRWIAAEGLVNTGNGCIKPLLNALMHDFESTYLREGTSHVLKHLQDLDKYEDSLKLIPALKSRDKFEALEATKRLFSQL